MTFSAEKGKNKAEDVHTEHCKWPQFGPLTRMPPQGMMGTLTPTQLHYTATSETLKFILQTLNQTLGKFYKSWVIKAPIPVPNTQA